MAVGQVFIVALLLALLAAASGVVASWIGPPAWAKTKHALLIIFGLAVVTAAVTAFQLWRDSKEASPPQPTPTVTTPDVGPPVTPTPTTTTKIPSMSMSTSTMIPEPSSPSASSPVDSVTYLADLAPNVGEWDGSLTMLSYDGIVPIDGVQYTHGLFKQACFGPGDPSVFEYNLSRAYRTFSTTVGLTDNSASDWVSKIEFFADGVPKGTYTVRLGQSAQVNFPVKGALSLKVTVTTLSGGGCSAVKVIGAAMGDPVLVR